MIRIASVLLITFLAWVASGCASFPARPDTPALLEWAGKVDNKANESTDEKKGTESANSSKKGAESANSDKESANSDKESANSDKQEKTAPEDDVIKTDRPTFTASSTTVGKDHVQLETGYTFTHVKQNIDSHSFPEANLRFGLFGDWIEGRIGQNVMALNADGQGSGDSQFGAQDLLLGVKLALTKQKGLMPESALILQSSVPTGSPLLTQKQVCPGIDYIFSWEVIRIVCR